MYVHYYTEHNNAMFSCSAMWELPVAWGGAFTNSKKEADCIL